MKRIIEKIKSRGDAYVSQTVLILAIITTIIVVAIWAVLVINLKKNLIHVEEPITKGIHESLESLSDAFNETLQGDDAVAVDSLIIPKDSPFEITNEDELVSLQVLEQESLGDDVLSDGPDKEKIPVSDEQDKSTNE